MPGRKRSRFRLTAEVLDSHKKKAALPPSAEREKIEREIAMTDEKIDEIVCALYQIAAGEKRYFETS